MSKLPLADDPIARANLDRGGADRHDTAGGGPRRVDRTRFRSKQARLTRAWDRLLAFTDDLIGRAATWVERDRDKEGAVGDPYPPWADGLDEPPPLADDPRFGAALEDLDQRVFSDAGPDDTAWLEADHPDFFAGLDLEDNTPTVLRDDPNLGPALEKLDDPTGVRAAPGRRRPRRSTQPPRKTGRRPRFKSPS